MPGRMLPPSGGVSSLVADDDEQVHRADLFEERVLERVEPQHLLVAALPDVVGGLQAGDVVGAGLDRADAAADGAHGFGLHPDLHRLEAGGVVGADRRGDDVEQVFLRRADAEEGLGADQHGRM